MAQMYGTRAGIQSVVQFLFPAQCLTCDAIVDEDGALCGSCWGDTPFLTGALCDRCAVPLPGEIEAGDIAHCDACLGDPPPWQRGRAALLYEGNAARLVMALKHGDRHDLVAPFAAWMNRAGSDVLGQNSLLIPVPLHRFRLFRRSYNQAALLSSAIARLSGAEHGPEVLLRTRFTKPLGKLSPDERRAVLEGAIAVQRQAGVQGRAVVLVDDVMTSGATLRAATEALLSAGAGRVDVLTLARAARSP